MISLQFLSTLLVESSFFCQYSEVSQRSFQLVSKPSEVPSHNWHLCEAESLSSREKHILTFQPNGGGIKGKQTLNLVASRHIMQHRRQTDVPH